MKPKEKRFKKYTEAIQLKILHPNYESRVKIETIFKDLTPKELISGRVCTGVNRVLNKELRQGEDIPKYRISRRFVVFKDNSRMSISTEIFNYLKRDEELPHSFENYYA